MARKTSPGRGKSLSRLHGRGVATYICDRGIKANLPGMISRAGLRKTAASLYLSAMGSAVTIRTLAGDEILAAIDHLAQLRMRVFADWPYLYDGDAAYEAGYLREFVAEPDSLMIAAVDGARIVGAATASPMAGQKPAFRAPFEARGIDTSRLFYFGESVLLREYRGRGIGSAFFDGREAGARAWGANSATFAAVIRAADHPDRPADYVPLDGFWRKRGYAPVAGFVTELPWKEHGEARESPKRMQNWLRAI
jgi:GNAT superfamily N-acetyltransferase